MVDVYDHDEEPADPDERPAYDWDAWERNRLKSGWTRWWLLMMVGITIALTLQFILNDGKMMGS